MATNRSTRAGKVKDLKMRSLSAKKAKGVKGGLLPAVHVSQKVQKARGVPGGILVGMGDGSVR